jgi:hypothetical protein
VKRFRTLRCRIEDDLTQCIAEHDQPNARAAAGEMRGNSEWSAGSDDLQLSEKMCLRSVWGVALVAAVIEPAAG